MSDPSTRRPERKTGLAHLVAATGYSFAGLVRLSRESAFRQELAFAGIIAVVLAAGGASAGSWLVAIVLFVLLAAVEALNTAIEEVVDRTSPERSEYARDTKDLGSFAVACLLAANGLHALYAVWPA